MRPIVLELTPTEGLTLDGIVAAYRTERQKHGLAVSVTARIAEKIDRAIHDALEAEQPTEAVR